jgi:multisubunit Na+/H+ antiporter MnhE subunit
MSHVRRHARFWLGWFIPLNLLWLVFIGAFDVAETILGLFASAVAATAATSVRNTGLVDFRPRAMWLLAIWRVGPPTVTESWDLTKVVWRRIVHGEPIQSRFRTEKFPVDIDDPRTPARRAIRTIGQSIAPNAYVVGIDEEHDEVLVHEIVIPPRRRRRR